MALSKKATGPTNEREQATSRFQTPDGKIDERVLVAGCLLHELEALGTFVLHYTEPVHAGAVRALRGHTGHVCCDPADLTQSFFVELFADPKKILGGFDADRGGLRTWLPSVAFYVCSKMLRSRALTWPRATIVKASTDLGVVPDRSSSAPHPADVLARVMACLSWTTRTIVEARLGQGEFEKPLTVPQIAERLGMTTHEIYHKIYRMKRIRHILRMRRDHST